MPMQELFALMVFATAMAFTPGPNTMLAAALGANGGLRSAARFIVAVPFGWGLVLACCALGLGGLVQALPVLRGAIKWLGLAYLLWLAWQLARSTQLTGAADGGAFEIGFGKGVLLQLVNVKAWMSALLISAGWIAVADPMWPRLLLVLPLLMALGVASNFTYAVAGSALRRWLSQGRRLLWFNRGLAAVLVATALWMTRF